MFDDPITSIEIPGLKRFKRGKVREVFDLGGSLLFVATDRISCFDVVLDDGIPGKGIVLTGLSRFWFNFMSTVPNHFVSTDLSMLPAEAGGMIDRLRGRSMIVKKCDVIKVEWVVRGFLTGSGYKEYTKTGGLWGETLPAGLVEGSRLPRPLVTPTTKADQGHDLPLSLADAIASVPHGLGPGIVEQSIAIYERASKYAWERGLVLADTKFEWGILGGRAVLVDEILTPDSSRYWDRAQYETAHELLSYDKQFVRDYLEFAGWNKNPPPPPLPGHIIERTTEKYARLHEILVGSSITTRHLTGRHKRAR